MNISIDIVAHELKNFITCSQIHDDTDMTLFGVRMLSLDDEKDFDLEYFYVSTFYPEEVPDGVCLLFIDNTRVIPKTLENANVLIVSDEHDYSFYTNKILRIFEKYNHWYMEMADALEKHAGYQKMIDISTPIFNCGIALLNWNHDCLATNDVDMENAPLWDALKNGYGYKYKEIVDKSEPKISDLTADGIMEQNFNNIDQRFLYNVTITIDDLPMYGIGLHKMENPREPFEKNVTHLFPILTSFITKELTHINRTHPSKGMLYDSFLMDVLNGKITDADGVNEEEHLIQYDSGDNFQAGMILFKDEHFRSARLVQLSTDVEKMLPGSYCTVVDRYLFWLINLQSNEDFTSLSKSRLTLIQSFLTGYQAYLGISPVFNRLDDLKEKYLEAESALSYGLLFMMPGDEKRIFHFFDHLDYQLINYANKTIEVKNLIHPTIRIIKDYDRKHNTEFYYTMKKYLLNYGDITIDQLAKVMHIHRNTLRYRLEKVTELTGLDLNDLTTIKQIQLSIFCTDMYKDPKANLKQSL